MDLLRGNPPGLIEADSIGYLGGVKRKLEEIHENISERVDIRLSRVKTSGTIKRPSKFGSK